MRKARSFVMDLTPDSEALIDLALREDIGSGDITSECLVGANTTCSALIVSRDDYVIAGQSVARAVFAGINPDIIFEPVADDGSAVANGDVVSTINGPARGVLTGERTALNFMQRLTGVASLTRDYVQQARGRVEILDTRKTTPGMRAMEKHAVRCGGGRNHRMGLHDMALVKDNHRVLWRDGMQRDLGSAVSEIRAHSPGFPIEIEVESEEELRSALEHAPEWIMLDNMTPEQMRRCVEICDSRCKVEASGGVLLDSVDAIAETGVDAISIGALTHSAPAADLSLELTLS